MKKEYPLNSIIRFKNSDTRALVKEFTGIGNKCKYCAFCKIERNTFSGAIHDYGCSLSGINTKCGIDNQHELKSRFRRNFESNLRSDGLNIIYEILK